MNRKFLGGTALAAILAASPAMAQDMGSLRFTDETEMQTRVGEIDTDGDGSITREEYEVYLDGQEIAGTERETLLTDFDTIDSDADAVLIVTEIEAVMATSAEAEATGGQAAQVEVTQEEPTVAVQQPAPEVTVDQGNPTVEVAQPQPEVAVTQQEPQVEVTQQEPEVTVQQAEPTVAVEQGEAEVAIEQPEAQVEIDAPAPDVEVRQAQPDVEVQQVQPRVSVEQPEPEVSVQQAEAQVQVETEEPVVNIEQGEPDVVIQQVTEDADVEVAAAEVEAETEEVATEVEAEAEGVAEVTEETVETAAVDVDEVKPGEDGSSEEMRGAIPFQDLEGEAVYNNMGEEFGDIAEFVMRSDNGEIFAVVSAGGFLGLVGDTEIVFPYSDISMNGDRVIIDTNMTEDAIEEMEEYNDELYEVVPDDMIVR